MTTITRFSDIVEANGRTIRENNLAKQHGIAHGALVEVKYDRWHEGGACSKVHARLWVALRGRDCDGTPLYWLSERPMTEGEYESMSAMQRMFVSLVGGFSEESLTVVEVTEEIRRGVDALRWPHD